MYVIIKYTQSRNVNDLNSPCIRKHFYLLAKTHMHTLMILGRDCDMNWCLLQASAQFNSHIHLHRRTPVDSKFLPFYEPLVGGDHPRHHPTWRQGSAPGYR